MKRLLIAATFLAGTTGALAAAPTVDVKTSIGVVMTAENSGMTLYTFRKDKRGRSNCSGSCAKSWPPFLVGQNRSANDGFVIVKRPDGKQQWATSAGLPLYFWAGDARPGDTSGDGVGGLWDAARR